MAERDYLVTARKYRPSLFREVVAQGHVTDTLKNAIKLDRLAHAYLFSGPRGVGKTTAARILAKAINCETPREEREEGAEPCCECDSCTSFEDGRSLNVFEMDAASNNKVDDIRELREKVRIPPQGEQKKVYILDEVHMLSKQAFNALLKTLEEPPAHALFIFATTEPHKVLPTILSRCQRFDFRRIPVPRIVDRLREICETEGVEADEESLMLLARKGNGALRDALSAFDQALSLCGTTLEYGELAQAMGVVDQDLYFDLTSHVAEQNTAGVLELVRHVVRSGYDLQEFLVGLAEHLRNLLVVHSLGGDALEGVAETTRQRYTDEADRFGEADLLRLLTVAGEAEDEVKNSPQPRLKLETTLLKMAQMRRAADLRTVIQKVERMEQMVEDGTLPDALPDARASTSEEDPGDPSSSQETSESADPTPSYETDAPSDEAQGDRDAADGSGDDAQREADAADTASASSGTPADDDASVPAPPSPPVSAREEEDGSQERDGADEGETDEDEQPAFTPPTEAPDAEDDPSSTSDEEDASDPDRAPGKSGPTGGETEEGNVEYGDLFGTPALDDDASSGGDGASGDALSDSDGEDPSGTAGPDAQAAVAEPSVDTASGDVDGVAQEWPQFVEFVKQDQISIGSLLGETEPVELADGVLTVSVPKSLHRDSLREEKSLLLDRFGNRFDVSIDEMRFVVEEDASEEEGGTTDEEPVSPREQLQNLRETYASLDVLFEEFGAEPVW